MSRGGSRAIVTSVTRAFVHCRMCGDRIGFYEPIAVLDAGRRITSLAREPLLPQSGVELAHLPCATPAIAEPEPARDDSGGPLGCV